MNTATPNFGEVYFHFCPTSQKGYVGQTTAGMEKRWKLHQRCARSVKTPAHEGLIARAIRKYGADSFEHQVLSVARSQAQLDNLEKVWIILLGAKAPGGYNLADGGYAAAGHIVSPEVRARLSAKQKENWKNPILRAKYSSGNLGVKQTPDRIETRIAALRGKKQSAETIAKRVAKTTGMTRTDAQIQHIRDGHSGVGHTGGWPKGKSRPPVSDETIAKIIAKTTGQKRTPEQIQNVLNGITPAGRERNRISLLGNTRTLGYKFSSEVIARRTATAKLNRENKARQAGKEKELYV